MPLITKGILPLWCMANLLWEGWWVHKVDLLVALVLVALKPDKHAEQPLVHLVVLARYRCLGSAEIQIARDRQPMQV